MKNVEKRLTQFYFYTDEAPIIIKKCSSCVHTFGSQHHDLKYLYTFIVVLHLKILESALLMCALRDFK